MEPVQKKLTFPSNYFGARHCTNYLHEGLDSNLYVHFGQEPGGSVAVVNCMVSGVWDTWTGAGILPLSV